MTLGEKIKKIRKERKLSQGALAQKTNINSNHLSRLERGLFQPSAEVLKRLAQTLEVSVDYLLTEDIADHSGEVHIKNKPLADRIKLIDQLDPYDQEALIRVIDSMLTKQQMKQLLENKHAHVGESL